MRYIRTLDGTTVAAAEACCTNGAVRDGYRVTMDDGEYVGFDMAFRDSAGGPRMSFRDASVSLTDAEQSRAVALAERDHRITHAWMGDRAPAFTDAQHAAAIRDATTTKQATTLTDHAAGVRDAATVTARVMRDAAYARRHIRGDVDRTHVRRLSAQSAAAGAAIRSAPRRVAVAGGRAVADAR